MSNPTQRDLAKELNEITRRLRDLERRPNNRFVPQFTNSECLDLFGDGSGLEPFWYGIRIDGDSANQLTCADDGLFVGGGQSVGWDAVVDGSIVASDPDARLFQGIGEALAYLDGLGMNNVAVAVRAIDTVYDETADWATPDFVHLFGLRGHGAEVGLVSGGTAEGLQWAWNGFQPSTQPKSYHLENFSHIEPEPNTNFGTFDSTPIGYLRATNCNFTTNHQSATLALCTDGYFEGCTFRFLSNASTAVRLCNNSGTFVQCDLEMSPSGGGTQNLTLGVSSLLAAACRIQCATAGTHNLNLPASADIELTYKKARQPTSTPTGICNVIVASSSRSKLTLHSETVGSNQHLFNVSATSSFVSLEVYGECRAVISGAHSSLLLNANCHSFWDITGPANVNTQIFGTGTITFRGQGISGSVSADGITGSPTILNYVSCDYSSIIAGLDATGASAGATPYAFDANSDNNILTVAGASTFGTAGTDLGTGNLVTVT